jgi:hypothetical protein
MVVVWVVLIVVANVVVETPAENATEVVYELVPVGPE